MYGLQSVKLCSMNTLIKLTCPHQMLWIFDGNLPDTPYKLFGWVGRQVPDYKHVPVMFPGVKAKVMHEYPVHNAV